MILHSLGQLIYSSLNARFNKWQFIKLIKLYLIIYGIQLIEPVSEGVFFFRLCSCEYQKSKTTNGLAHSIGHLKILGKKRICLKWFVHHSSCKYWRSAWNQRISLAFENPLIWFHSLCDRKCSIGNVNESASILSESVRIKITNLHTQLMYLYSFISC